jgi:hypothetical protein
VRLELSDRSWHGTDEVRATRLRSGSSGSWPPQRSSPGTLAARPDSVSVAGSDWPLASWTERIRSRLTRPSEGDHSRNATPTIPLSRTTPDPRAGAPAATPQAVSQDPSRGSGGHRRALRSADARVTARRPERPVSPYAVPSGVCGQTPPHDRHGRHLSRPRSRAVGHRGLRLSGSVARYPGRANR